MSDLSETINDSTSSPVSAPVPVSAASVASIDTRHEGIVREYDRAKGCGIIVTESGQQASVRYAAIDGRGVRVLKTGDHVTFEIEQNQRGLSAVRVRKLS